MEKEWLQTPCTQVAGHQPILPAFLRGNAQANAHYKQLGHFDVRLYKLKLL